MLQIFERLQKGLDPKLEEEKARRSAERQHAYEKKAQERLSGLLDINATLPCTIASIHIRNAVHTRRSFLSHIFSPILTSDDSSRPYTLAEALREVSLGVEQLHRFDIFHQPIDLTIARPSPTDPNTTPTDIDVYLDVREKPRLHVKTGTDIGNAEGSAYATINLRNALGGAETVNLNAALGTRTRSAYQASFESPILAGLRRDLRAEVGGLASTTQNFFASHEQVLKGGWLKSHWLATNGTSRHEVMYSGMWRQITGLGAGASPTVRADAGDSFKSAISHTWVRDGRDNPSLPTRGVLTKTISELAGWGPLAGDVAFAKVEAQSQAALPVPLPWISDDSGVSLTAGFRGGLIYPLPLGFSSQKASPTRINDRFNLGGPTDVRGFRLCGLGPHDGADAVGGDVYAAGSLNLLMPIPRVGVERPLRFQAFINGGRLLALQSGSSSSTSAEDPNVGKGSPSAGGQLLRTVKELGNGLPSTAAGIGLVYAHPYARFELNITLPLVMRQGEDARKGLQLGLGINML